MVIPTEWQGDNPYCLMIATDDERVLFIDLDEHGWATTYADWLREPSWWRLVQKVFDRPRVVLDVRVNQGDQGYFTARHIGVTGSGGSNEIIAYGIGKKCADGSMVRLWSLPDGSVCGGDDVDVLGVRLLHMIGPRR